MYSPLGATEEYDIPIPGTDLPALQVAEHLEPVDYRILALLFQGKTMEAVAQEVERARSEVVARVERPRFEHLKKGVEKGIVEQIAKGGEFEPITIARANSSPAMRRIIALSKTCRDPRVYLQANKEVLHFAGAEPPRRVELVTPDKVLDEMTPEELAHFANTREWPLRFKDKLAQFLKYEGGEVTLTQQKSVTFSHAKGTPAKTDEPDEKSFAPGLKGQKHSTYHGYHTDLEADETVVAVEKAQTAKPWQPKLPFIPT